MNLTNLTYFIAAAEELNFTKAARRLYISQQALSSHIAKLEAYYQVSLFDRGKHLTLTEAGQVLYQSALQVTATLKACDRRLQDIKYFIQGSLSVGIPVTRGTILLPHLCFDFQEMYPKIHLEIFEGQTTAEVEKALTSGRVDLALGYVPQDSSNIISDPLYWETYVLVVPNRLLESSFDASDLASMRNEPQSVSLFSNIPFIAQSESTMGGKMFRQICSEADMEPHVVLTVSNILTQLNLCASGLGACTLPSTFVQSGDRFPGSLWEEIAGSETLSRVTIFQLNTATGTAQLAVNRLRSRQLTAAGRDFIRLAQQRFHD